MVRLEVPEGWTVEPSEMRLHFAYEGEEVAARFEVTATEIRHGAPLLGEHTRAIMSELGFSGAEIDGLIAEGVIGDFQLEDQS